jgi:hypothetical protein
MLGESAAYGGFADAAGGIASVVLAVVGLAGTASESMVAIAVIVFGAALLIQGGTLLSEYAGIMFPPGSRAPAAGEFGGSSLSAVFLAGIAGIVLGILALLGLSPAVLTAAAIIAFGAALVLSSNSVWHLHTLKRSALAAEKPAAGSEILANEMAFGSASLQALAGLAGVVLGIIGLAGVHTVTLALARPARTRRHADPDGKHPECYRAELHAARPGDARSAHGGLSVASCLYHIPAIWYVVYQYRACVVSLVHRTIHQGSPP